MAIHRIRCICEQRDGGRRVCPLPDKIMVYNQMVSDLGVIVEEGMEGELMRVERPSRTVVRDIRIQGMLLMRRMDEVEGHVKCKLVNVC